MKTPKVKRPSKKILAHIHSLKRERGMIAAIEPGSGEWFVGKSVIEALHNARIKYPHGIYYFDRIGSTSAHVHKGVIRKI
jgi:hypothetical protein